MSEVEAEEIERTLLGRSAAMLELRRQLRALAGAALGARWRPGSEADEGLWQRVAAVLVDGLCAWVSTDKEPAAQPGAASATVAAALFGQGAAQSFEDAAALSGAFALHGRDVATALLHYERVRHYRATRFQLSSKFAFDHLRARDTAEQKALLEGLALFVILWIYSRKPRPTMAVSGAFLVGYGVFRFFVEFVRVPDEHIGYLAFDWVTMGQVLSTPMIIAGAVLLYLAYRPTAKKEATT